jgi:tetratricopeptide (TPR) repeat protein
MGEFGAALEAQARARAIGEAIASRQVQACAAWGTGIIHAAMGDWEAGVVACQRGLELAPDPLNWAITAGWSGYAYLEKGDAASAIPLLEKSTRQLGQFQLPHVRGLFTAFLAEAYQLGGETEKAFDLAMQALDATAGAKSPYGVGVARRALGRIAAARGDLSEAANHLDQGLRTFASIQARYDLARTHLDLGVVGDAQGYRDAAVAHLGEAHDLFDAMGVSRYAERTRELIAFQPKSATS